MSTTLTTAAMPDIRVIPIAEIHESPLNTRIHFDPIKLAELAASMRTSGQLTPVLARPSTLPGKSGFELAAGHRRRRAAEPAGISELMVIVRDLDDRTFLEILTIDNLQREDVHPLEEAQGYRNLLTIDGYDVNQIAERVSKSESYVYDRLTLLRMIPELQELFFAHRLTLGHAVLLARQAPSVQKKLVEDTDGVGGMWRRDHGHATLGLANPDDEQGEYGGVVPVSVRELQQWIDTYVRFDVEDAAVPQLFPETATTLAQAEAQKEKVVDITRNYHVHPDAKDAEGARTFGPTSWKRADGQPDEGRFGNNPGKPSTCEYSVVGLVAVGEGRGDSFRVCVDKKRCTVHWGEEIRERNKRERARTSRPEGSSPSSSAKSDGAAEKREAERKAREEENARFQKAVPSVLAALGRAVRQAPTGSNSPIAKYLWEQQRHGAWGLDNASKKAAKYVPRGASAGDFVRHLTMCFLVLDCDDHSLDEVVESVKDLKLGVEIAKIMDAVAPKAQPKPEPKKVKAKNPVAKKAKSAKKKRPSAGTN